MAARAAEPMVGVAQLVELRIVDPAVVGSNPIVHPKTVVPAGIGACEVAGLRLNRQTTSHGERS